MRLAFIGDSMLQTAATLEGVDALPNASAFGECCYTVLQRMPFATCC